MSYYSEVRKMNQRIYTIVTTVSMDEQEAKDIINTILHYAKTQNEICKNNKQKQDFIHHVFDDLAIIDTTKKTPEVKKILIEDL